MEVMFERTSSYDDLGFDQFTDTPLFPAAFGDSCEANLDQMSDETASAEPSCVSSSSPTSPGGVEAVPVEQANVQFPPSPVVKREREFDSPVYEPPVKRERIEDSPVQSPVNVVPASVSPSAKDLQALAKGRSEDIELYRNMLRCHGSLTPDVEKQLRHLSRQVKNRESAQISRKRKREYVEQLRNVIVKMQTVDNSLRADLTAAHTEAAQRKAEADRWQAYARDLQKLLKEHGLEVPAEPAAPSVSVSQSVHEPQEDFLTEALFDGPCGFGHMAPPKGLSNTTSSRRRKESKKQKQ